MKRALILSASYAGYHADEAAFAFLAQELARWGIASAERATATEALLHLEGVDLLVVYTDGGELPAEQERSLIQWVESGGALVALHGATASFPQARGYLRLLGARFQEHPPLTRFSVFRADAQHMITVRLPESFSVEDELYIMEPLSPFHTLLTVRYQGKELPIAWVREQGKGRVCYLGLGHTPQVLQLWPVADFICHGCRWALGQSPRPPMRVGLVGYGGAFGMGHFHGTLVSNTPGLELVAACDINPKQMEVAAQDFPGIRTYTDPAALAAEPDVDFVVIILPHNLHAPVAAQFLDAGKHVMVEKPFTITAAEAVALIEKARSLGLTLTVFHNRRWDRDYLALKQVIAEGRIGEPWLFEYFSAGFGHPGYWWRSDKAVSGGIMHDWGAHMVDWALNLARDEVESVMAWTQKRRWFDVTNADAAKLVARFRGGQLLDIEFGSLSAARKAYMRILGTRGAIEVGPPNRDIGRQILVHREGENGLIEELIPYSAPRRQQGRPQWAEWSAVEELYIQLANHFLLGDPVPVTPESAARVIGVLEAANIAAEKGQPQRPTYP